MPAGKLLWKPSENVIRQANMTRFIDFVNEKHGLAIDSYFQLYNWSIENIADFWATIWEFAPIIFSRKYDKVVDDLAKFPGAEWFEGARLNFAENLLRHKDNHPAFIFKGENQRTATITYAQLHDQVGRLANALRETGVVPGDGVVAYMPNQPETAIAMLAAMSVGASWASCGVDLGASVTLDRLGQIQPKVFVTTDGYFYKGKEFGTLPNAEAIAKNIPSLEKVVVVPFLREKPRINGIPHAVLYEEFLASETSEVQFEQLPFSHPGYVMFSSGTTGKPKCMVQSAGGVLINHLKELILHTDLKREDTIMYITSCSWMMWNWLMSSLAVGATILLYDGNPNYPDSGAMWKLVEDLKITVFGCSASYINYLRSQDFRPKERYDLSSLREISQTGSPLSAEGFEYVYEAVKGDLHFNSIAGGTDINGCFTAGSPTLPVHAGELQAPALGMKIKAYDENADAVLDRQGELVCEAPAPSMPLYFWNDPTGEKYLDAYFRFYPGKRVWRHGDYIMVHSRTGGVTHLGRSDAILKPSGVRIGTAEIYNVVEKLAEVADSLAVGQNWRGDQRIILFVKLAQGQNLTDALKEKIKNSLRENASPRHVPALIIQVPDIPYTFNLKKVEIAVWNIIHGKPVQNREALVNPESLDYFVKIAPQLQKEK